MIRRIAGPLAVLAAFSLAAARPAHATITPEARAVVERYLAATGGRDAFERIHSTHSWIKLQAFGFAGSAETWTVSPDRDASDISLGPFHVEDGYDGTRGWRLDPGGKVLTLDGKDLEDAASGAWFSNERWLAADQGGGSVSVKSHERDSTGTYVVLDVTPPRGRGRALWFDESTGLLAKSVAVRDVQTVVTTNLEWTTVAGRKVASRVRQEVVGAPVNTLVQTLDSLVTNEDVPAARFAPPDERPAEVQWLAQQGVARIPMAYRGRHVWVRASVDGQPPADFLIDTGASMSVIDSAYAARIGLQQSGTMEGQGASASGAVSFAVLDSLRVGPPGGDGIAMRGVKVGVLSVNSMLAPFFWRDCAGIIGFNVLNRFVVRIDYDHQTLTFSDPKTFQYAGTGTKIPFRLAGFIPVVPMTIDGRYSGDFRLDVGSGSTVDLHSPFVKEHQLLEGGRKTLEVMGGGFGGTFTSELTRMKSIQLGPYSWKAPVVALQTGDTGLLASSDYAGNVGNQILDRFTVTFDYEHRVLWLEPGKGLARRDPFSRLGAQLVLIDGKVHAGQVLPNSPAEQAGLKDMDEIETIDGKPALDYGPDGIDRKFELGAPGTKTTLEVKRDGKTMKLVATLREMI